MTEHLHGSAIMEAHIARTDPRRAADIAELARLREQLRNTRPVRQPDYQALGFAGAADAEGRN